ncbi:hypothetical protein ILYODFUR_020427 [Ilyodon furcidens]|uniref:Uncharacterized protein n=1 Tax=Ilyodon furcidens TaxID=33524 RepID=A0ABV0UUT0_9TELE
MPCLDSSLEGAPLAIFLSFLQYELRPFIGLMPFVSLDILGLAKLLALYNDISGGPLWTRMSRSMWQPALSVPRVRVPSILLIASSNLLPSPTDPGCRSVLVQLTPRLNCFPSFKISRKVLDSIPAGCY